MLTINHIDFLEKNTIFYNKLNSKEKEIVTTNSYTVKFPSGKTLLSGDDKCSGFIIVISGC
ncbi:MAG: hypothetical protein RR730_09930, partial [Clostridium sp.]